MPTTRGKLEAATITSKEDSSLSVWCMFNPEKYTVTKSNNWSSAAGGMGGSGNCNQMSVGRIPKKPVFTSYGRSTLKLDRLIFDTYETGDDLAEITDKLWLLMSPSDPSNPKSSPPEIKFEWSTFSFEAVITKIAIDYTLFDKDGKPVRATVDIEFMESSDPSQERQNPTSGGGPIDRVHQVTVGDRLDLIAANVYGDSTLWRLIAERNGITNPRSLQPGQQLTIPQR